ncbi:MAG: ribonuclease inhibitor [Acidobacteria bacterium]|nr:ribonuclease inhibitor [Acidobacteriota bacterium]
MREVVCPVTHSYHSSEDVLAELAPLVEFLESDRAAAEQTVFPRGVVTPDGRLDLCKQSIGIEGCARLTEALKHNRKIGAILFGTDGIGSEGARHVAGLIAENDTLETVYLGCNDIESDGVAALAGALGENRTVRGLWLKRNPIGVDGAKSLAAMLRVNRTLEILDLVNTVPGPEGLAALLDVLIGENRTLRKLYLSGNGLDAADAERLKTLLIENDALDTLMLSVNHLGDAGVRTLAAGLGHNKTLRTLSLASNGISASGAAALLESLPEDTALEYLDLGYAISTRVLNAQNNALGDEIAPAVRDFLKRNRTLRQLEMINTGLTGVGLDAIFEGVLENPVLSRLRVNGRLPERVLSRLKANGEKSAVVVSPGVRAIKSVYRTARKTADSAAV